MENNWKPNDITCPLYVKFMDKEGTTQWGVFESSEQTQAACIEGSFFEGTIKKTGEMKDVHKIMAPCPVTPPVIYGIALNHKEHAEAIGFPFPETPCLFMKATHTINDPGEDVIIPKICQDPPEVDYEPEVAIIIGKDCKNVTPEQAWDYIFGYTMVNDVTAQIALREGSGGQWNFGKNFDTFTPMGPTVVTHTDYVNAGMPNITLTSHLNGKEVQKGNTSYLHHKFNQIISFLSQDFTIKEGSIIMTGTMGPPGWSQNPRRVFMDGDHFAITGSIFGTLHMGFKNSQTNFKYQS